VKTATTGKAVIIFLILAVAAYLELMAPIDLNKTSDVVDAASPFRSNLSFIEVPTGNRMIRIRVWDDGWVLPKYNAQQIIQMISTLKPDVLERYVSDNIQPNALVPVAKGSQQMTVAQFLNASMSACAAENCYIIPRLGLGLYDKGKLFSTSEALLSMPVYPKMRLVSLDDWANFSTTHTPQQIISMFQQLYAQGWSGIGVNDCGGYFTAYGYASWADFGIHTKPGRSIWTPALSTLTLIQSDHSIKRALLYIDFNSQMLPFNNTLTPDQEAAVLAYNLTATQATFGITFVYPILQDFWNSFQHVTSQNSPWKGASLFTVQDELIAQYNPS